MPEPVLDCFGNPIAYKTTTISDEALEALARYRDVFFSDHNAPGYTDRLAMAATLAANLTGRDLIHLIVARRPDFKGTT